MYKSISAGLIAAAVLGVLLMLVVFARDYGAALAIVPTHFGASGEPNAWGPKSTFVIFPVIGIAMLGIVVAISTFGLPPRPGPVPPALPILTCLMFVETIWTVAFAEFGTFAVALGRAVGLSPGFFITLAAVLLTAVGVAIVAISTACRQNR